MTRGYDAEPDAPTGLSAVHVNRSLQFLRKENLVWFDHKRVVVPNWHELASWADFNDNYLASKAPKRLIKEVEAALA
jgi:hypothetical protein